MNTLHTARIRENVPLQQTEMILSILSIPKSHIAADVHTCRFILYHRISLQSRIVIATVKLLCVLRISSSILFGYLAWDVARFKRLLAL